MAGTVPEAAAMRSPERRARVRVAMIGAGGRLYGSPA
jgi:hypothetical protein